MKMEGTGGIPVPGIFDRRRRYLTPTVLVGRSRRGRPREQWGGQHRIHWSRLMDAMQKEEILKILVSTAREIFDDEDVDFTLATPFSEIPDWDSLSNMHIIVRVERKLGITFQQTDFPAMSKIGELVDIIGQKVDSRAG